MTSEIPQTPGEDITTGVIYEIIHTMDGKGQVAPGDQVNAMASGSTAEGTEAPGSNKLSARLNADLEDWLVQDWALNRRSIAQRRVLGCLGCKLASRPGRNGMVTSREIAACTGMDNAGVRRILGRLTDSGYLFSRIIPRKPDGSKYMNRPPEQFSLTRDGVRQNFKGQLEAPDECGLESEGGQLRPNAAGEKILIEAGVLDIRGNIPRAVLGCLACKQQTGEGVFLTGIEKCQSVAHGRALDTLRRFVDADVLQATTEENRTGQGKPRIFYTFTDSDLAKSVRASLDTPTQCGLNNGDEGEA